jgi:hypothetical protein
MESKLISVMKKLVLVSIILLLVIACKKTKFSPEGPTDIRIRNISDQAFQDVIVSTSERTDDIDTLGTIISGGVSEYFRFHKAYPKAKISAKINIDGSLKLYSTGPVNYTYMQYIGQDRITFEVFISNVEKKELTISNIIIEEPLVLK